MHVCVPENVCAWKSQEMIFPTLLADVHEKSANCRSMLSGRPYFQNKNNDNEKTTLAGGNILIVRSKVFLLHAINIFFMYITICVLCTRMSLIRPRNIHTYPTTARAPYAQG
jgi:hypothetical protein